MNDEQLQAGLDELNRRLPVDMDIPSFLGNARHGCPKSRLSGPEGREVSTALEVREVYAYGWAADGEPVLAPGGEELAIIYKQGRCRNHCGYDGRSSRGWVVRVEDRPPLAGRVAR